MLAVTKLLWMCHASNLPRNYSQTDWWMFACDWQKWMFLERWNMLGTFPDVWRVSLVQVRTSLGELFTWWISPFAFLGPNNCWSPLSFHGICQLAGVHPGSVVPPSDHIDRKQNRFVFTSMRRIWHRLGLWQFACDCLALFWGLFCRLNICCHCSFIVFKFSVIASCSICRAFVFVCVIYIGASCYWTPPSLQNK